MPGGRTPRRIVAHVLELLDRGPLRLRAQSPIIETPPLGPSIRRFANAAALIETHLDPPALLGYLKGMERAANRRRGQRWGNRTLDLDIILWSGGPWGSAGLTIPHAAFRARAFVLTPLAAIAADWRDPISNLAVRHLAARLHKRALSIPV